MAHDNPGGFGGPGPGGWTGAGVRQSAWQGRSTEFPALEEPPETQASSQMPLASATFPKGENKQPVTEGSGGK